MAVYDISAIKFSAPARGIEVWALCLKITTDDCIGQANAGLGNGIPYVCPENQGGKSI